jgi:oligoendopeptidase F
MAQNKTKDRSEIDDKYKWDLSSLYKSEEEWAKSVSDADAMIEVLGEYEGHLADSAEMMYKFMTKTEEISSNISNIYCYAYLRQSEDTRISESQKMVQQATMLSVKFGTAISFAEPEILSMSKEKFGKFISSEILKPYKFKLEDMLRMKKHILSKKEEKLMAGASEVLDASGRISEMLMDADLKFTPASDSDGKKHDVTSSSYIDLQMSSDRKLRASSFKSLYSGYSSHINTFAATYSTNLRSDVFSSKTRDFSSSLEMAMNPDNIPVSVYDNLVETVHKYLPEMYKYERLRKKMLGIKSLHYYDLYAPLVSSLKIKYTYEQARAAVLEALSVLGKDYIKVVENGYASGWVDVFPNTGKSSGAYSFGTYSSHPYIMMNFTGNIDSVSTLAHETGHSMHSYYTNHTQPQQYSDYSLFIAEVASTVNECLLIEHLLSQDISKEMRLYLLNQYLENFKGTVFRQTMFAEFEKKCHELSDNDVPISAEGFNKIYLDLIKLYFGKELTVDPEVGFEWARIPHFYRSFYVYQYATGYSAAVSLATGILKNGAPAVKAYKEFLSMGSSVYPLESLKHAGVDLTTSAPVSDALSKFGDIITEFEETAGIKI